MNNSLILEMAVGEYIYLGEENRPSVEEIYKLIQEEEGEWLPDKVIPLQVFEGSVNSWFLEHIDLLKEKYENLYQKAYCKGVVATANHISEIFSWDDIAEDEKIEKLHDFVTLVREKEGNNVT